MIVLIKFEHNRLAINEGDLHCPLSINVSPFEQLLDELKRPHLEHILVFLQFVFGDGQVRGRLFVVGVYKNKLIIDNAQKTVSHCQRFNQPHFFEPHRNL